jgi:hypothetical protein
MSALDSILGQVAQNVDIRNLAAKVGLSPEQVESAVTALARSRVAPGDTASGAAAATGLPTGTLSEIIGHIGGEGSLGQFATLLQGQEGLLGNVGGMLDRDGDGNPLNDFGGLAQNFLGGNRT